MSSSGLGKLLVLGKRLRAPGARNWKIRDLRTKAEEDFLTSSNGWVLDRRFSPAGDRVAFSWNREDRSGPGLWVMTWPGRELRRLADRLEPAGWSPDGEWIYAYMIIVPVTAGHAATSASRS